MEISSGTGEAGRGSGRERRSYVWFAYAGAVQRTRGERSARRGAGESDPQEPRPLAEDLPDRSWNAARQGTGLAEHLHAHQEPGRVSDHKARHWLTRGRGATGNRRNFDFQAFSWME